MIAGTFSFEDLSIHWSMPDSKDGQTIVRVTNGLDGESAKVLCHPRAFAASMALALDFDGMESSDVQEGLYKLAETIPFPSNNLRWIP